MRSHSKKKIVQQIPSWEIIFSPWFITKYRLWFLSSELRSASLRCRKVKHFSNVKCFHRSLWKWSNPVALLIAESWRRRCFIYPICIKVDVAITSARKRKSTEPSGKYTTNHLRRSGQANSEMGDIKCCSKVDCLSTEQEREREGEGGGGGCFITLPGRVALKAHGKLAPFYVAHTQACLGALKYSVFCFCRGLEGRKEGGGGII